MRDWNPPWLEIAIGELGIQEIPGEMHNPRIIEYHAFTTLMATDDETPWCSSFVNWCMRTDPGGTGSAAARSWLLWGIPIVHPARGCVVVLRRAGPRQPGPDIIAAKGHVGLLVGINEPGGVTIVGGNQNNRVCEQSYPVSRVLGYRWPG